MAVYSSPNLVTNGLIYSIDPSNVKSYPGSGTSAYDFLGLTASLVNGPSYSSLFGGYFSFDGVDDYLNLGNIFGWTTESFSFSFWVYINTFTTNQPSQGPVVFYKGSYNISGYYLQISPLGELQFTTNQGGASQSTLSSVNSCKLKTWHHVTITRNGSSSRLYVDGVDITSNIGTHINPSFTNNNFLIANYQGGYIYSNLNISLFNGYNRALTASEVAQLYNATKDRYSYKEDIVRNGLLFNYDIASPVSYINPSTTIQSTINNYIGTLTNGPTYNSGNGGYLSFDGTNDYINIIPSATSFTYNRSSFTVGGWTYMTSLPVSYYGVILSKWNTGGGNDNEFILNTDDGNKFLFAVDFDDSLTPNSQSNDFVLSTTVIVANTWYYVVGTFENGLTKIYVNGILESSIQSSFTTVKTNLNSSLDIGRFGTSFYSTGRRGVVHFYNRALSSTEILSNFNALRGRYGI